MLQWHHMCIVLDLKLNISLKTFSLLKEALPHKYLSWYKVLKTVGLNQMWEKWLFTIPLCHSRKWEIQTRIASNGCISYRNVYSFSILVLKIGQVPHKSYLFIEMDSAICFGMTLALSDQANDCKVAFKRVINIVLLKAYSASNLWAIWNE